MNSFARPCTIYPLVSQSGANPYTARGSRNIQTLEVPLDNGQMLVTKTYKMGIRSSEFVIPPVKGDKVEWPDFTPSLFVIDRHDPDRAGGIMFTLRAVSQV